MSDFAATQSFYGRWARFYDLLASAPGVRSWRSAAADALSLSPGDTVVEMGCGTGANVPHLRERVGQRGRIVGLDLTSGMLDQAHERVDAAGWDNVHLVRADARRPPINGPVDAVLGTFVTGMFADPDVAVERWLDLLAPDGSIALLNATRSPHAVAAPLNLAFQTFVRFASPGGGTGPPDANAPSSATAVLESRVDRATDTLVDGTRQHDSRRLAGGFVTLRWGSTPV